MLSGRAAYFHHCHIKKSQNPYLDFILLKFLPKARCCIDLFLLSHTIRVDRSDSKPGKKKTDGVRTHVTGDVPQWGGCLC